MCDKAGGTNDSRRIRHAPAIAAGLLAAALLAARPALALDPHTRLRDYNHTIWTERDGVPAQINSMMQTPAGWILIGARDGLYRFDGSRFEVLTLPRQDEPGRSRIENFYAAPNGDLLFSYAVAGGLSVLHPDGSLEDLAGLYATFDSVRNFAGAADGTVWAATARGLHYIKGKSTVAVGEDAGLPQGAVYNVMFERGGRMWLTHEEGIFFREKDATRFVKHSDLHGFASLIRATDGSVWVAEQSADRVELLTSSPNLAGAVGVADQIESRITSLFDRDGNLWTISCGKKMCMTPAAAVSGKTQLLPAALADAKIAEVLPTAPGKTPMVMEDSEGSVWIANDSTLERYRDSRVMAARTAVDTGPSMAVDDAGRAWVVDRETQTAWIMAAGGDTADRSQPFQMVSNDFHGGILLAGKRELERRWQGKTEKIALPPATGGKVVDLDVLGLQDDGRVIWMYARQTGLVGYVDGRWQPHDHFNLPKNIMLSTPGGNGRFWIACADQSIVLYDNDKLTRYDGKAIGAATVLQWTDQLVVAGDLGMAVLKGERLVLLGAADPAAIRNVSGIAISADGDRWLNGGKGLLHVKAADWRASMADPAVPLRYELIDALDGYAGRAYLDNRLPSIVAGKDGQLWISTTDGLLHMDIRAKRRPAAPPRIGITALNNDGAVHAVHAVHSGAILSLPPAPRNVSIDYAAPGMSRPEAVRFQYRLAGEDGAWQDAGARRTAFYTSLAPGRHRFEVRAANQDGVWNSAPATVDFAVAPTLTQTGWFRTLLAALALFSLWLLYRWRLRTVSAQIRARMDERVDERNRIARELHDTLLQSVQGLMLKVHGAAMRLAPTEPVKPLLQSALEQAESTIAEARARVRDLRGDDAAGLSLADMLTAVGLELANGADGPDGSDGSDGYRRAPARFTVQVQGQLRELSAGASRELFAIGREAIVNAFRHAGAGRIEVRLVFGSRAVTLQVADDGAGIPADFSGASGRAGHWGIGGMRERAAAIGAQLQVGRADIGGAAIVVEVPAARAYKEGARPWWRRL